MQYDYSVLRPFGLTSKFYDFKKQIAINQQFNFDNTQGPVYFVVKKNVSVLKKALN